MKILFGLVLFCGFLHCSNIDQEQVAITILDRPSTRVDANDPLEDLCHRSMKIFFKEGSEDIARRVSPIIIRHAHTHTTKTTINIDEVTDEQIASQMSPVIIDYLDQEIVKQSTDINNIQAENKKSRRKLIISLVGGATALMGLISTIIVHFKSCESP